MAGRDFIIRDKGPLSAGEDSRLRILSFRIKTIARALWAQSEVADCNTEVQADLIAFSEILEESGAEMEHLIDRALSHGVETTTSKI